LAVLNGACKESPEEGLQRAAQGYWDKKMYGMAAEKYEQAFRANPDHPKAEMCLYKAAFLHAYYLQEPTRAIDLFLGIPARYPDGQMRRKAHAHLAEIFADQMKRYPEAIAQVDQLMELRRPNGEDLCDLYLKKADCLFKMEDWKGAREACQRCVSERPGGPGADRAAYQIGYTHFLEGNYPEAEAAMRSFLETYPDSEWAFDGMLHLARAKEEQQQKLDSEALYGRLREQFPGRAARVGAGEGTPAP